MKPASAAACSERAPVSELPLRSAARDSSAAACAAPISCQLPNPWASLELRIAASAVSASSKRPDSIHIQEPSQCA